MCWVACPRCWGEDECVMLQHSFRMFDVWDVTKEKEGGGGEDMG